MTSESHTNSTSYTQGKPGEFTMAANTKYIAFPSSWGTPTFKVNPLGSWVDYNGEWVDTGTTVQYYPGVTYKIWKHTSDIKTAIKFQINF